MSVVDETVQPAHVSLWLRRDAMKAWVAWGAIVAILVATLVLLVLGFGHDTPVDDYGLSAWGGVVFAVAALSFGTVGALIVARVEHNRIGWIFWLTGLSLAVGNLAFQYADHGLYVAEPRWPGATFAAWLPLGIPPAFGLLGLALLLFPDGRLPSRRWRPALVMALAGIAFIVVGYGLRPGPLDAPFDVVDNPFGIPGAKEPLDALSGLGWLLMGLSVGLAAVAMSRRLRRARGVERQQLKWLAFAAAITGTAIVADVISYFIQDTGFESVRNAVLAFAFAVFPVAAGAAILRYRLFDIDVVINRTLVYGALTATLGATYLALVLLIGLALGTSNLAIAVSTLAVAALFRPARARIQAAVDRRFYRRRYDAARTLEAFGARLRDELDLEALRREICAASSGETVQPAHVTLWLRSTRNDSRTHGP